jgi:hypothetical protein
MSLGGAVSDSAVNRVLSMLAALAAALLPILVDVHVLTSTVAADIGSGVAILIAGWHGNTAVTALRSKATGTNS